MDQNPHIDWPDNMQAREDRARWNNADAKRAYMRHYTFGSKVRNARRKLASLEEEAGRLGDRRLQAQIRAAGKAWDDAASSLSDERKAR